MSVNKVILIGNVGKDPDIRYLDNNVCVANFPLATTYRAYTTRAGVQIPEKTEWHNIVLWRGLAEIAEKYVRKGTQLYIEGKIRTRSWVDQSNITRYTTEIYAENMSNSIFAFSPDGEQILIALYEDGASADPLTRLYHYENGKLVETGQI